MMAGAFCRSSMDSKSGTGCRPGSIPAGFNANSAETRKPEDVKHIFGAGRSADDVLANGFRRVGLLQFGDGAKGVEDLSGLLAQSRRQRQLSSPPGCHAEISAMAAAWTRACWRMSSVCRCSP